jgi:D-aminopeptidase
VLVQCNYGRRGQLRIAGAPVGEEITDLLPCMTPVAGAVATPGTPVCTTSSRRADGSGGELGGATASNATRRRDDPGDGSIIIVVATDAPLLPHQLKRLAKRAALGIGRMGGTASNGSGDIFVAFSTANPGADGKPEPVNVQMLGNDQLSTLFEATAQATEEAITNALVAARTLTGADGFTVYALPHDRLRAALRKYNRLQ